jgi:hypothetical protein
MTCWVFEELQREWDLVFRQNDEHVQLDDPVLELLCAISEHRKECNLCKPGLGEARPDRFHVIAEQFIAEIDAAIARLEQVRDLLSPGALKDARPSAPPSN